MKKCSYLVVLLLIFSVTAQLEGLSRSHAHRCKKSETVRTQRPFEIVMKKIDAINGVQFSLPCYAIMTRNGRLDHKYNLILRNLAGELSYQGSFNLNKEGFLENESGLGQHLVLFNGFQPGEPVVCFLISEDKEQLAQVVVVPWPITCTNRLGYRLDVEVLSHYYRTFSVLAKGFVPGAPLTVTTEYCDKVIESKGNASREGNFEHLIIIGDAVEEGGGVLRFTIDTPDGSITMKLPWGSEYKKQGNEFIARKNEEFSKIKDKISGVSRKNSQ